MPGLGGGSPLLWGAGAKPQGFQHQGAGPDSRERQRGWKEPPGGRHRGLRGSFLSLAGFSHLPSGLYPSYLHLNHLEPPSSGSPLLSQLGQPSIFDTQKGQTAGVVGTLGGGLWNGMGGDHYPSTPDHHPGCVSQDSSPERPPQAPGAHP